MRNSPQKFDVHQEITNRIAVILHRMWKDDTDFRVDVPALHAI